MVIIGDPRQMIQVTGWRITAAATARQRAQVDGSH
jgi:hypothetical protein